MLKFSWERDVQPLVCLHCFSYRIIYTLNLARAGIENQLVRPRKGAD